MPTIFLLRAHKFRHFYIYHSYEFNVVLIEITFKLYFNADALFIALIVGPHTKLICWFIYNSYSYFVLYFDLAQVESNVEIFLIPNLVPLKVMDNLNLAILYNLKICLFWYEPTIALTLNMSLLWVQFKIDGKHLSKLLAVLENVTDLAVDGALFYYCFVYSKLKCSAQIFLSYLRRHWIRYILLASQIRHGLFNLKLTWFALSS